MCRMRGKTEQDDILVIAVLNKFVCKMRSIIFYDEESPATYLSLPTMFFKVLYLLISLNIIGIPRGSSSKQYIIVEVIFLHPFI